MSSMSSLSDCKALEQCLGLNKSQKVGRGGFATVSKFRCKNKQYIRKDIQFESTAVNKDSYDAEVNAFEILNSSTSSGHRGRTNVVQIICAVEYPDKGTLVLDVADTNLWYYAGRKSIPKKRLLSMFDQLQLGMDFFHSKKIIHNDIKSSNILVLRNENLQFCDFGNATVFKSFDKPDLELIEDVLHIKNGTYHPPETVSTGRTRTRIVKDYDPRCKDYWCLGEVFFYVMYQKEPFSVKALNGILESGKLRRKMPAWLKTSLLSVDFKHRTPVELSPDLEVPARPSMSGGGAIRRLDHWNDLFKP